MLVDGYPGPGEYVRPVVYDAPTKEELDAIIARATRCEQYIKYVCYQSKLLSDACTCDFLSFLLVNCVFFLIMRKVMYVYFSALLTL